MINFLMTILSIVIGLQISFLIINRDIEVITKRAIKKALYEIYEDKKR